MFRHSNEDVENASTVEGGQQAFVAVQRFLTQIRKSPENEGSVDVTLSQTSTGKTHTKADNDSVGVFPFDMHTDIDELTKEIVDAAIEDCEGLHAKISKYHVKVEGLKPRGVFTLTGDDGSVEDIDDIDDMPNRKGLLGLMMRHNEGQHRLSIGTSKHLVDALMAQLEKKEEIILKLQNQAMENIKAYEELVSGRHMRDLEMKKVENKDRRMDQLAGTVLQGFPLLVTKFLGGGAGAAAMQAVPGARTPMETLLEGFVRTLDSEQFSAIVQSGIFRPDQVAGLVEIVKFVMEREEADKAKAAGDSAASPPNGAAHAEPTQQPQP
jgi:hypothetical protein